MLIEESLIIARLSLGGAIWSNYFFEGGLFEGPSCALSSLPLLAETLIRLFLPFSSISLSSSSTANTLSFPPSPIAYFLSPLALAWYFRLS